MSDIDYSDMRKWFDLPTVEPDHKQIENTLRSLNTISRLIEQLSKLNEDDSIEDFMSYASDIEWELRGIENAIDIIEDFNCIDIQPYEDELYVRLEQDEIDEIRKQKMLNILSGKNT